MKIVIISDIHDNLINLKKCLEWCCVNNIKKMICCGDITNSETLKFLSENFCGNIYLVRGNIEIYEDSEIEYFDNIKYFGKIGRIELGGKIFGICHEPYLIDKILEKEKCDIIFYGHTHSPWEAKKGTVKLINPGTLGGMFGKATFAVWNSEKDELELKVLDLIYD